MTPLYFMIEQTPPKGRAGYIAIDEQLSGQFTVTVRQRDEVFVGAHAPSQIVVTQAQLTEMARGILDFFGGT